MLITLDGIKSFVADAVQEPLLNDDYLSFKQFYLNLEKKYAASQPLPLSAIYQLLDGLFLLEDESELILDNFLENFKQKYNNIPIPIFYTLKKAGIFNFENFESIALYAERQSTLILEKTIVALKKADLLTDRILQLILKVEYLPQLFTYPLKFFLEDKGHFICTEENLENLILSNNPTLYYAALHGLQHRGLQSSPYVASLKKHADDPDYGLALAILKAHHLDTDVNKNFIKTKRYDRYDNSKALLADALVLANKFVLNEDNCNELYQFVSPQMITILKKIDIINNENIKKILKVDPYFLSTVFKALEEHGLEIAEFLPLILNSQYPNSLNFAISMLRGRKSNNANLARPDLLSKEGLLKLLKPENIDYAIAFNILFFAKLNNINTVNQLINDQAFTEKDKKNIQKALLKLILHPDHLKYVHLSGIDILSIAQRFQLVDGTFIEFINFLKKNNFAPIKGFSQLNELIINHFEQYPDFILELCSVYDENFAEKISDASLSKIMYIANHNTHVNHLLAQYFGRLLNIQFYDRGASQDTWWRFTKALIDRAPAPHTLKKYLSDELFKDRPPLKAEPFNLREALKNGLKFLRLQGRTIILEDNAHNIVAIKIIKDKEPREELDKEHDAVKFLNDNKSKLKLDCYIPEQQGIFVLEDDLLETLKAHNSEQNMAELLTLIGEKKEYHAYIYRVDKEHTDYFTYLHDASLSDEQFEIACDNALKSMFCVLSCGILFHELAEIFHNNEVGNEQRKDLGRFIVLSNILSPLALCGKPKGLGRLTDWLGAIEYPNFRGRMAPLADLGGAVSIKACMFDGEFAKRFFSTANQKLQQKVGNYIVANFIAEYLYILFLITGRRGVALNQEAIAKGNTKEEIDAIWFKLADQVVDHSALAVSLLTMQNRSQAKASLLSFIEIKQLARQMQFFMTREYIPYFENEKIPKDIYGKDTVVNIDMSKFRQGTFNSEVGFSINHVDPDLGPVNGQEPEKEANKLIYETINKIASAYLEFNLTLDNFKNLSKNPFTHLSGKAFHCAHIELDKLLLASQKLPDEVKEKIKQDLSHHEQEKVTFTKQEAAHTLFRIWKNKSKPACKGPSLRPLSRLV